MSAPDGTIQAAARWSARLRADDCTPEDQIRFTAWLGEHPRHREIFALMSGVWASSATLGRSTRPRAPAAARRTVLAMGAGLAATLFGLPGTPAEATVLRTATGECRHALLPGGADLLLDTGSMLVLPPTPPPTRTRDQPRDQAWLAYGRIGVALPAHAGPLRLATIAGPLTSTAGQFDIRLLPDRLAATVLEGTLTAGAITIGRGARLTLRAGHPPLIDHPRLDDLIAWRTGRVVFRDTQLAEAIAEMNRYSNRKMEIPSPAIGALRISGLYHTGNIDGFAHALTHLLPVRIENGKTLLIVKL